MRKLTYKIVEETENSKSWIEFITDRTPNGLKSNI